MFCILCKNPAGLARAMYILAAFHVKFQAFSENLESQNDTYVVVDEETKEGHLELAEMTMTQHLDMQISSSVCPHCKRIREADDRGKTVEDQVKSCGHLTFG